MIHAITSSLPKFKNLTFRPGLNVLLADKTPQSTDRQTRNGAGKSSLVEIIHFLTGSDCGPKSFFRNKALVNAEFSMVFDLAGTKVSVTRSAREPNKVYVDGWNFTWPIPPVREETTGKWALSNADWKLNLGALMFGLDISVEKFAPTFRSLFPYFARRQGAGGFLTPVKHTVEQSIGNYQVAISYLLGLDWTIPQKWETVRERERMLKELRKAVAEGALGDVIGSTADLRTKLTVAQERARRLQEAIANFQVLPEYHELEAEASDLTRRLGRLADENTLDLELIAELEQSLQNETPPKMHDLERLYDEVGVILPSNVRRRFAEVREFHESVIANRKMYLASEIERAQQRILARNQEMEKLSARRSEIMAILKSHGALEQFTLLQTELTKVQAQIEVLRKQFEAAEQLEGKKSELTLERAQLLQRLQQDFREQETKLRKAIVAFEDISTSLYERAGSLTIDPSLNGPQFEVKIEGQRSKGISNMQIFCFDFMLMKITSERGIGPGFLIHDSHLFDGVDERQIAKALFIGAQMAEEYGFQYIVTMNSDDVPSSFPPGFSIEDHLLPVRLTDNTEDGGLFGIRF